MIFGEFYDCVAPLFQDLALYFARTRAYDGDLVTAFLFLEIVMVRCLTAALLCLCVWSAAPADGQVTIDPSRKSVALADGQTVANPRILGPTQELLQPVLAGETLYGEDYFEWCMRWNKLEEHLAEQRAIAPRSIRGSVSSGSSFSVGAVGRSLFGCTSGSRRTTFSSQSREQVWRIGGYGGGPVTIYNPFVDNASLR